MFSILVWNIGSYKVVVGKGRFYEFFQSNQKHYFILNVKYIAWTPYVSDNVLAVRISS